MRRIKAKLYGLIRGGTVGIAFLLQLATMFLLGIFLRRGFFTIYLFVELLSVLTVFAMVNDEENYKASWVLIILLLPVTGFFLYFMWGRKRTNSREYKRLRELDRITENLLEQDGEVLHEIRRQHPNKVQISRYLRNEGYPVYQNTSVSYFKVGEDLFGSLMDDMKQAKKFILLEYFIVSDGKLWSEILDILTQKAAEGVEVKLLFDDFGVLLLNNKDFRADIKKRGLELVIYNPIHKGISRLSFNYRNHQKIAVIDGNIGYTGGANIADEYVNYITRFGHWKDTGIRLYGEGVWSLTCIFLKMWKISIGNQYEIEYEKYKPTEKANEQGFVQPFAGGPHKNPNNPVEGAYTRMINKARDYVYITTPYLVLDRSMQEDLISAARSDVDVRIIVPGIPDKKAVYMVNVSNYGPLMQAGVRIYEYRPGFVHAKNVISDDECAICGTINTDYRSFYHHYECGAFLSETDAVLDMKKDFMDTLNYCEEISLDKWKKRPFVSKCIQAVLKILSPLL